MCQIRPDLGSYRCDMNQSDNVSDTEKGTGNKIASFRQKKEEWNICQTNWITHTHTLFLFLSPYTRSLLAYDVDQNGLQSH